MAPSRVLDRRVRPRLETEQEEEVGKNGYLEDASTVDQGSAEELEASEGGSDSDASGASDEVEDDEAVSDNDESDVSNSPNDDQSALHNISFGALAKAQASLGKRKRPTTSNQTVAEQYDRGDVDLYNKKRRQNSNEDRPEKDRSKSSKHGPATQSTKFPVSRKRTILEPSAMHKSRDPRFDPAVLSSNHLPSSVEKASRNYSFLTSYRHSEVSALKAAIRNPKTPDADKEQLKQQVMAMENRARAVEAKEAEHEIVRKHRQKEKELIREGKKDKPYFLKKSDVRKEMLMEKYKGMGAKQRDKSMRKKRKKVAGKELKGMPRQRRE